MAKNYYNFFRGLNKMADNILGVPKREGMADKFVLIGVNARGAEFITFMDRPGVINFPSGYEKLIIYKEYEVIR